MPWRETDAMNERVKFIVGYLEEESSFAELCDQYGISRKTGYKWVQRYSDGGVEALHEHSRAPGNHPNATAPEVIQRIVEIRRQHPLWGAKKLLIVLQRRFPEIEFPSKSTVGEILRRNNLVRERKRRRKSFPHTEPLRPYEGPNAVWCADFKGHFLVGSRRCHPLTITDGFSRYLLECRALPKPCHHPSQKAFERVFREYGLPDVIRTDNGPPFSTVAPFGLSRLAVWWTRLGILPERIMPARPEQNGRHERMHRTLKAATAKPPRASFSAQQRAFDAFRQEYNEVRPHEALGQKVPADFYQRSHRSYPSKLPEIQYPDDFELCRVYPNGVISICRTQWYISRALCEEWVGIQQLSDDRFKVYFGKLELGIADLRNVRRWRNRNFSYLVPTGRDRGWHGVLLGHREP